MKMNLGSALEKFAALVNLENRPTKVNWTVSWPSTLEISGKTARITGLISSLILLGQGGKHLFFRKKMFIIDMCRYVYTFFVDQKCSPKISCHNSEPFKQCMGSDFLAQ